MEDKLKRESDLKKDEALEEVNEEILENTSGDEVYENIEKPSNKKETESYDKKLKKKLKKVIKNDDKEKIKELEAALLRKDADLINYRRRKDEEVSRMLKFANEDLIKEFLPIVDNFERAIKLDDTDLTDELSKFLAGFKMIYCHLVETLEKYDVKAIDGINKPFDPKYHQAVLTEKVDGVEPSMVVEVMQKGYLYKGKVIRPAMVKVSE